jgi:hypothetical protein
LPGRGITQNARPINTKRSIVFIAPPPCTSTPHNQGRDSTQDRLVGKTKRAWRLASPRP